jgi:hypothetical protein
LCAYGRRSLCTSHSEIALRIRGHPTGLPSAQERIMISPHSAQEGTISRRLEYKSFISKPLDSATRFIALSDGRVTVPTRKSRVERCTSFGTFPVSRVSANHPNPTWHPKPSSLRPPVPPTQHHTVPRAAPESRRSTSGPGPEVLRRDSGVATGKFY